MSDDIAVVATASGQIEAEILRGLLEAHGIPVWLLGESAGTAIGLGVGPLGQVEVRVPKDYEERAREALAQYYQDRLFKPDPDDP